MSGTAFSVLFTALLIFNLIFFTAGKKQDLTEKTDNIPVFNKIYPIKIPGNLSFAGEQVPLEMFDVKERLDRELLINTYWHSSTIYYLKLANRWFPVIEPILKKNNIPEDFKYLALAESGLQNKVSPKNAEGVWQFLKGTAREYGLEVANGIDERYHLEKATEAACKYLKTAYDKFGTWTMAAAAYNMGMPGLDKQVERQKENIYYDLLFNRETARYMFRIIALKELVKYPRKYGFYLIEEDLYKPLEYQTVSVDTSINSIADFAKQHDTNYKMLKLLNPWLRASSLKNDKGKAYVIKLPE